MRYSRRDILKTAMAGLIAAPPRSSGIDSAFRGVQLGCISYSYRDMTLDAAIQAMAATGIGECELFMGHVEPAQNSRGAEARAELHKWRLSVSLDVFRAVRAKFDAAGSARGGVPEER